MALGFLEQACDLTWLGDIGFDSNGFGAQSLDLFYCCFCSFGGIGIVDDNGSTSGCKF